jgi:quinol monooxygenase YgiN
MKKIKLILGIMLMIPFFKFNAIYAQSNNELIVLVKYKTQPGKDSVALSAFKSLVEKVKKEPGYVSISIHVDPSDRSNILLYEKWSNETYFKGDHMNTPHLQKFMSDARTFLSGPPEITFWSVYN